MDVKKTFGSLVRARRNQLGISQEELAERADLHRTYVSDVERGSRNISLENIERLALALDISIPSLFLNNNGSDNGNNFSGLVDVLLVEDEADHAELAMRAFKRSRFANRIRLVQDGEEALDYLFRLGKYAKRKFSETPHIILLDLNLPKINGFEVLRRIKSDKRTRGIPVIVLTISHEAEDLEKSKQLGADNYIVKPVDILGLIQATPGLNLDWALLKSKTGN
ncbi:MAG TPA: response regulator [Verrucomicrobiae bacterium]|nr:response regulator [Verrucomicrobiae bacterium]